MSKLPFIKFFPSDWIADTRSLEWWFSLKPEKAPYRKTKLSTLLNGWNGEITRAVEAYAKAKPERANPPSPQEIQERKKRSAEQIEMRANRLRRRLDNLEPLSACDKLDLEAELDWFNGSLPDDIKVMVEERRRQEDLSQR